MARLSIVSLLDHSHADELPTLSANVLHDRLARTHRRASEAGLDILAVYADREHSANMAYLTGFDPRFEEALLLLAGDGRRKLLVGNECLGYLPEAPLGLEVERFQDFSLLGQPRGDSRPLLRILHDFGIGSGSRVGCAGWKYFDGRLVPRGEQALDVPAYLADSLRALCGDRGRVTNATPLFTHPQTGLRVTCEPEQIVHFEFAAATASSGLRAVLERIRPGVRERDLERHYDSRGLTLSCHRMLSFGEKARRGLASPGSRRAALGDVYTAAFGVTGGLLSRGGVVARSPDDVPAELREFYPRFAENYFDVTADWYEALRVGAATRDVYQAAESRRDPALFKFALNPGHYLHLDEWVHSPFSAESDVRLASGMVLQMDIIPVSRGPFCYTNAEDGVVLADAELQAELARRFPECWKRLAARRDWVRSALGIALHDTVFPLADTTGWFPPYIMDLTQAFAR